MDAVAEGEGQPSYGVPIWRLLTGVVIVPALLLGGVTVWTLSVDARLPDPMATHFTFGGTPNGATSLAALLGAVLPPAVLTWALGLLAVLVGRDRRVRFRAERGAMAWCSGVTAFMATVLALTVGANLDQPSWASARLPAVAIVVVLLVAAFCAVLSWALAGTPPELPPAVPVAGPSGSLRVASLVGREVTVRPAPVVELGPADHPVWQRHLRSTPLLGVGFGILALGIVLYVVNPVAGVLAAVCALVTLPLGSITAVVDETGLDVRFGPMAWPRKHVPLARIAAVHAADISPLQWGGWGYRIGPGRSAVVLRGGPGIVVELVDGRAFAVTIGDPEPGVALLDAYRRRLQGG